MAFMSPWHMALIAGLAIWHDMACWSAIWLAGLPCSHGIGDECQLGGLAGLAGRLARLVGTGLMALALRCLYGCCRPDIVDM
jgi:hypothetical protein